MILSELEQMRGSISNIDVWYGDYPLVRIVCENGLCFSVPIISYTQKRSVESVVAVVSFFASHVGFEAIGDAVPYPFFRSVWSHADPVLRGGCDDDCSKSDTFCVVLI